METTKAPVSRRYDIKALHTPYWGENNPYQGRLADELGNLGVNVELRNLHTFFATPRFLMRRPDLIHLHWVFTFYAAHNRYKAAFRLETFETQMRLLKRLGTRMVWTAHNLQSHEDMHPTLDRMCSRFCAHMADTIIVHCETARETVARAFDVEDRDKFVVIPHAHFQDDYPPAISREEARLELKMDSETPFALFFGTIRPYKGLLELVEAWKTSAPEGCLLKIAGRIHSDGAFRVAKEATEDRDDIEFEAGHISPERAALLFSAADFVALPFRRILTSGTAHLAATFGRAIVAPRENCLIDLLGDDGGILYPKDEGNHIGEALREALENREKMHERGDALGRRVADWGWPQMAKATREVYDSLL